MKGERGGGREGEEGRERERERVEPVLSEARASHDIRPVRSYEVVQPENQLAIFREDRSAVIRATPPPGDEGTRRSTVFENDASGDPERQE